MGADGNSLIIYSYFSMKTNVVTPHKNCLSEMILLNGQKICFSGKIWKIIAKLSLLPLLPGALKTYIEIPHKL